jgi:glycosyltransferase involved in cell wall biosynthesis
MKENNQIKISVVLSIYNGEKFLKEAVDSILSQTFSAFEFIIINDGSTDSTDEIISQYTDSRIVYINNPTNRGLTNSLNIGLSRSRGKYIVRMDGDDIALPNRLQVQFDYMETHPETGICGSSTNLFYENKTKKQRVDFAADDLKIRAFTFFQSPFCHPSVIIRKEVLDQHHLKYPENYYRAEDYGLWIELLKYTKGANILSVLLHYRKHEESETAIADKKIEDRIEVVKRVQEQYLRQNEIFLQPEQIDVYTRFTDRSFPYTLNFNTQKSVEKVLKIFLLQLSQKQKSLHPEVMHYLSVNCFYKFFINRKFPLSCFLLKLFIKGAFDYIKKFIGIKY